MARLAVLACSLQRSIANVSKPNLTAFTIVAGTPLQNNLEELWALLNMLMPTLFQCVEDFSTWFGGSEGQQALSEEEALLVTNRLHQVLRPFVLRRLKDAVASDLPTKVRHLCGRICHDRADRPWQVDAGGWRGGLQSLRQSSLCG